MDTFENSTDPNWVQRLGTAAYIFAAAVFAIIGAFVGFVSLVLVAIATSASDGSTALLALLGGILGLCGPIYVFARKRRANRSPTTTIERPSERLANPPLQAAGAASTAGAEQTPPVGPPSDGHEWFYSDDGKRIGPVSTAHMRELLSARTIERTTKVWLRGFADWKNLSDTELSPSESSQEPPPLAADAIGNGYAWALAFAPLWASLLHYTLAYAYLSHQFGLFYQVQLDALLIKTWYFWWGANSLVAILDEQAIKRAGWDSSKRLSSWLTILVPVYLYKRDQMFGAGVTRFLIWMACFFVSLTPLWM